MIITLWNLLYPFSAFLFIRGALRSFAAWAAKPRPGVLLSGMLFATLTFHAGWHMFGWAAILPHWWLTPLIVLAFAWIGIKNVHHLWKFEPTRNPKSNIGEDTHGSEEDL